jgi:hypothetical protein
VVSITTLSFRPRSQLSNYEMDMAMQRTMLQRT